MGSEDDSEGDRYWHRESGKTSRNIFLSFIAVSIAMLIIVISLGTYTYISWQDLKERPKLRAENAQFEFNNATEGKANITVHLTLKNKGEEKADSIILEWFVMERENASKNLILTEGNRSFSSIKSGSLREITFKLLLPKGSYKIAYRTYEEGIFTYEGGQDFRVLEQDTDKGSKGASEEEEGSGADTPMISTPIFLLIIVLYAVYRWRYKDE